MQYIWDNGVRVRFSTREPSLIFQTLQVDQGLNNYIRIPPNNNPVTDVTSTDLTCNVGGTSGSSVSTVSIAAGTNITYAFCLVFFPSLYS